MNKDTGNEKLLQELYTGLAKIQRELKAPKNQKNSFGNYNYRSCEDILEALKPLLNGFVLTITDEVVNVGDRYYVKATAIFSNGAHSIENTAFAREAETKKGMDDAQITGSASSYARKYALNGLFAIDDTKDADTMDNREVKPKQSAVNNYRASVSTGELASPKQIAMIVKLLNDKGRTDEELKAKYKINSKKELTKLQASNIIENLLKLPDVEKIEEPEIDLDEVETGINS